MRRVQLDAMAADVGAGVIVAGAYGHSRFRELILGGMTQHLDHPIGALRIAVALEANAV